MPTNDHTTNLVTPAMRCIAWRRLVRNTLRGFAVLEMRSGLTLSDVAIHQKDGRCWASPPGRPKLDADGTALRHPETGKIDYAAIISFASKQLRWRWSDEAIAAVRRDHPEAFTAPPDAAPASRSRRPDLDDPIPF